MRLSFLITLIGHGIRGLPEILASLERMGRDGLGSERIPFRVHSVSDVLSTTETNLFDPAVRTVQKAPEIGDLRGESNRREAHLADPTDLILRFVTPMHLVREGRPVREFDLPVLLARLHQRLESLTLLHGEGSEAWGPMRCPDGGGSGSDEPVPGSSTEPKAGHRASTPLGDSPALVELARSVRVQRSAVRWVRWTHRSNRQRRSVPLSGLIGDVTLAKVPAPCLSWLRAGQWVHVGKATSSGLGRYEVELLEDRWIEGGPGDPTGPRHDENLARDEQEGF